MTHPPLNMPMIWLIFFLVMAFLEMVTPFFGLILVGGSGVVAAALAAMGYPFQIQMTAFVVACLLSMGLLRPKIIKKLHSQAHVPNRTEGLLGKTGEVLQSIDPKSGAGRIVVNGEDWAAQSETPIPEGAKVKVTGADGIILIVSREN